MIPFESEHQFMATLHGAAGGRVIYKKGAAERLLERCTDALDDRGELVALDKDACARAVERMAARVAGARLRAAVDAAPSTHGSNTATSPTA